MTLDFSLDALRADLSARVEKLTGPGSNRVRSLLLRFLTAVEVHEQDARRLGAEVLREPEPLATPSTSPSCPPTWPFIPQLGAANDVQDTVRECRHLISALAATAGRWAFPVQSAAGQLLRGLELYEQDQRRLRSELLRQKLAR